MRRVKNILNIGTYLIRKNNIIFRQKVLLLRSLWEVNDFSDWEWSGKAGNTAVDMYHISDQLDLVWYSSRIGLNFNQD